MPRRHTVRHVIEQAFPDGFRDHARYKRELKRRSPTKSKEPEQPAPPVLCLEHPPCSAIDLFAIAGQLLLKSGAYHHVSPEVSSAASANKLVVTETMRREWRRVGREWRGKPGSDLPPPPAKLIAHWNNLVAYADEPVFRPAGYTATSRKWWGHALALFCIADEAALDIGFTGAELPSAQAEFVEFPLRARQKTAKTRIGKKGPTSFSFDADQEVLAVLPKSRTTNVGCTLRSLSHNLALLPGRGQAQAHWSLTPVEQLASTKNDPEPFNLVVLPIPFAIQATAFQGKPANTSSWGWFDVEPHWCPRSNAIGDVASLDEFLAFVEALLDKAELDPGPIHGLVLPEVALSEGVFRALCERLKERKGFELLISGLFDAQAPVGNRIRQGNFTGMARFFRTESAQSFDIAIREKHHRWRVDRGQIETYALGSALDVNRGWWEHIDILNRSLDVFVIRGTATVTTLICEDLARNDPCQELVRGIGPNFVVALLMDGPQRQDRWPARYATVLADDPGSSVLTVTSLGLIERTNQTGKFPPANQIGLFRDDTGKATEIQLPKGAHGVCLTLQPTVLKEHSLDGRPDKGDAQSWRLSAVQPVRLTGDYDKILMGQWPAK